jgi:hypothetical protein
MTEGPGITAEQIIAKTDVVVRHKLYRIVDDVRRVVELIDSVRRIDPKAAKRKRKPKLPQAKPIITARESAAGSKKESK